MVLRALLGQPLPALLVQDVPPDDFGTVINVGGGSTLRNGGRGRVGLLRDAFDEDEEEIGGGRGGGPRGGGGGFALD